MKRVLIKLDAKDFSKEIGGKKVVEVGGNYYCAKCGYKMLPSVQITGRERFQRAEFFIDTACFCDQS